MCFCSGYEGSMMKVFRSSHQNLLRAWSVNIPKGQNRSNYHSALGYFRIQFRMVSTFSQLSRHSCAYLFLVLISTISRSYPHFLVYFFLFLTLSLSIAHSRAPFHSMTPPPWFAASMTTNLLPPPKNDALRYARCIAVSDVSMCKHLPMK